MKIRQRLTLARYKLRHLVAYLRTVPHTARQRYRGHVGEARIIRVMELGTGHLPEDVADILTNDRDTALHLWGLILHNFEYGWLIYVPRGDAMDTYLTDAAPDELAAVMQYAQDAGVQS